MCYETEVEEVHLEKWILKHQRGNVIMYSSSIWEMERWPVVVSRGWKDVLSLPKTMTLGWLSAYCWSSVFEGQPFIYGDVNWVIIEILIESIDGEYCLTLDSRCLHYTMSTNQPENLIVILCITEWLRLMPQFFLSTLDHII